MAVDAINKNSTFLTNINLKLMALDGQCRPDKVMSAFVHYCFGTRNVVGILGPACSETVEPIAGKFAR